MHPKLIIRNHQLSHLQKDMKGVNYSTENTCSTHQRKKESDNHHLIPLTPYNCVTLPNAKYITTCREF